MDDFRFDVLVKSIVAARGSRRGILRTLLATGGAAAVGAFGTRVNADAKKKGKKAKQKVKCRSGQKRCGRRCIATDSCCAEIDCYPALKICLNNGSCYSPLVECINGTCIRCESGDCCNRTGFHLFCDGKCVFSAPGGGFEPPPSCDTGLPDGCPQRGKTVCEGDQLRCISTQDAPAECG